MFFRKNDFFRDDYLKSGEDRDEVEEIRKKTREGQPYGEEGFVVKLEKKLGMKIRRGKRGRPKTKGLKEAK